MRQDTVIASVKDAAALRVAVFGPCRLLRATGHEIDISNRRARALLGMLALAPGEAIDRDHVSKLLWPGRFEAQARASLRQCLLEFGRVLDPDTLETDRQRVAIRKGAVLTDLGALEAALSEARADAAIALLEEIGARPLLDQMDMGEPFAAWLADQRRHIEGRLQVGVDRALAELKRTGDDDGYARLKAAWRAFARWPAPMTWGKVRIAVLPLEQHDEVGGPLFLAEGVGEELQSRLGGIAGLAVIGRTSVGTVFQEGGTLPDMARRLEADYLVEGTTWRFANRVRISLRLIDGPSGTEIWSDTYDGAVDEMLVSRHILGGQAIAGLCKAMRVEASPAPARTMTPSREAYALYLQGRSLTLKGLGEGVIDRGIELLEQSLEIDPDFAECWTALAEAHVYHCVVTPALDRPERAEKMADCARRALELDPGQGHAQVMLALAAFINHRPREALDRAFEAHRMDPNNLDVAVRLGSLLMYIGRTREALPYIEAAIDRDPVQGRTYIALCSANMCLGEHDKAIRAGQRMVDLGIPGLWLGVAQAASGDHKAAFESYYAQRVHLGTTIMRPPGTPPMDDAARDAYFQIAAGGVCSGDPTARVAYCQLLDRLHVSMADPYDHSILMPAVWMGHAELVMKLYEERLTLANIFSLLGLWADVDPINRTWKHPDFLPFAERVGLVEAWDRYGWPDHLPKPEVR